MGTKTALKIEIMVLNKYGHESWVMTERMRLQVQASEMRFVQRIEGVTLFNKVRRSEIQKSLNIEPLLLRIERSPLRWFGHVSRMPQERLSKQALLAKANGERPVGRPRAKWTNYTKDLGWNHLGFQTKRNDGCDGKTVKCGGLISSCCPRNPHGKVGNEESRKEECSILLH